jgi:transglutaminase-like putative cysteine protease
MKDSLIQRPLSPSLFWFGSILLVLATAPHAWNLSPFVSSSFAVFVMMRLGFWRQPDKPAPAWLIVLLLALCVGLVLYQADLTEGRQFGVALLVLMAGMKLLEMKTRRDLYVLIFLGYFILITLFLFYQAPLMTAYVLIISTGFTAALIANNLIDNKLPLKLLLKKSMFLMVSSIPLMILLFVLFPRLEGPLWSLNLGGNSGKTGMSDNIRMGSISNLSQSQEIAFRVRFEGEVPPPADRYWRGMVLWITDGKNWHRSSYPPGLSLFQATSKPLGYEITMEASGQSWLFPLDHILKPSKGLMLNRDGELSVLKNINSRFTWKGSSSLEVKPQSLSRREWQLGLQLPDNISGKTEQLAASLRGSSNNDAEVVKAALNFFNQQPFVYTLQPPLMLDNPIDQFLFDTRKGFCEHYATSFVILMRLADIPARVVVGYQGGEFNPLGGHLVVRQSDAHAWAEVWVDEHGWVRVDPTAAVAPERIEHSILASDYINGAPVSFNFGDAPDFITGMVRNMRWFRDNLELQWHYWIVGFDNKRQQHLLERLGLPKLQDYQLALFTSVAAIFLAAAMFLLGLWRQVKPRDKLQHTYQLFILKLRKCGLEVPASIGPKDLGKLAEQAFPEKSFDIAAITRQYIALRYGAHPRQDMVAHFVSRVRRFRCKNQASSL